MQSSNLDGIRAIAVTLVVVSHAALMLVTGGKDHPAYSFQAMGHVGVAIFFVHTTLVLMASLDRHGSAPIPFYVRRFFRIYPLSVAVVLLMVLLRSAGEQPIDAGQVLSNLLLVQNITGDKSIPDPLWTLPYELQMYLVLPFLFGITRTRRPVMWASAIFAASVPLVLLLRPDSLEYRLLYLVPCFLPGLLAFVLARRIRPSVAPLALFTLVLAVGAVGIPMLVAGGAPETPLLWLLCLSLGLTIPHCRQLQDGPVARASKVVATYSYGIYITHVFALAAFGMVRGPFIVQLAVVLTLLAGLAYICYHGIEKHGIALGARIAARLGSLKRQNLRSAASAD